MIQRCFYVYILANKPFGTLYVGVTNDLIRRVFEHKQGAVEGFTREYGLHDLVYYEIHESVEAAISREAAETLEARLENRFDFKQESGMARCLCRYRDLASDF